MNNLEKQKISEELIIKITNRKNCNFCECEIEGECDCDEMKQLKEDIYKIIDKHISTHDQKLIERIEKLKFNKETIESRTYEEKCSSSKDVIKSCNNTLDKAIEILKTNKN